VSDVLLIDDNAVQLRVRESVLRDAGISVWCASSAEEALAFLRLLSAPVKAILTDHVMPGASGSDFVRQLRRLCPQVPVLVISGMCEAEGEYAGMDVTFLRKPCRPEVLIGELAAHCDQLAEKLEAGDLPPKG
jgi:CheY-like chemotaxis protein